MASLFPYGSLHVATRRQEGSGHHSSCCMSRHASRLAHNAMTVVTCSGCVCVQDRSYQFADAGEHGCRLAAHGCSHHGVKIIQLVAGTLSGVATFFTSIQRTCDIMPKTSYKQCLSSCSGMLFVPKVQLLCWCVCLVQCPQQAFVSEVD